MYFTYVLNITKRLEGSTKMLTMGVELWVF